MPDTDNVAKLRRNIATRIEWALKSDHPTQRLLDAAKHVHGGTKLSNLVNPCQTSALSKPRVLREAASDLTELEKAADATCLQILERLKRRHATTKIGRILRLPDSLKHWSSLQKSDVEATIALFIDRCGSLPLPEGAGVSAGRIAEFLTSATGRQFGYLAHLSDMDLAGWKSDQNVLRNVLRNLGNPADWIQTWLDAGTPYNVATRCYYGNFYSLLALRAVAATRRFPNNLWASRSQWAGKGYRVDDDEKGAPVFHYFQAPQPDDERFGDFAADGRTQGPLRRVSPVFNAAQVHGAVDGRSFRLKELVESRGDVDACVLRLGAKIVHRSRATPSYSPQTDSITMPPKTWFQTRGRPDQPTFDYYATLLHELVHWTGCKHRLARVYGKFGDAINSRSWRQS